MSNLIKNDIKRCGGRPKGARNKNPLSEKTKKRIAIAKKKYWDTHPEKKIELGIRVKKWFESLSEKEREEFRNLQKGKIRSKESVEKNRISHIGIIQSQETREKKRQFMLNNPKNKEVIEKMRLINKTRKHGPKSEEHKEKLRQAILNHPNYQERVKKLRYYSSINKHVSHTEEFKKKLSERMKEVHRTGKLILPLKDTKIEKTLQGFLINLGVEFIAHKVISDISHRYQCDLYVRKWNLVIEADGCYWHKFPHGNPIDHLRTAEMQAVGYKVLRLWEHEINKMNIESFILKVQTLCPDFPTGVISLQQAVAAGGGR